jgi:hypothetical protein
VLVKVSIELIALANVPTIPPAEFSMSLPAVVAPACAAAPAPFTLVSRPGRSVILTG